MNAILRQRVEESLYYKQHCFGLNAASLLDLSIKITSVGVYDNGKPSVFACLLIKLMEIQPSKEIIMFYITQHRFKYLKLLALLYHRLIYKDFNYLLEIINEDYRKIRISNNEFSLSYMDECIDILANKDEFYGFSLLEMDRNNNIL